MTTVTARLLRPLVPLAATAFLLASTASGQAAAAPTPAPQARVALVPSSWEVSPRATLTVTGPSFGRDRSGRRFVLQETTTSGKPATLELKIVDWSAERVILGVPDGGRDGARLYLLLLDEQGRVLARSAKPLTLVAAAAPGADPARLARSVPTPPAKDAAAQKQQSHEKEGAAGADKPPDTGGRVIQEDAEISDKRQLKPAPGPNTASDAKAAAGQRQNDEKLQASRDQESPDTQRSDTGKEAAARRQRGAAESGMASGGSAGRSSDRADGGQTSSAASLSDEQARQAGTAAPDGSSSNRTGDDGAPLGTYGPDPRARGSAVGIQPGPDIPRQRGQVRRVALVLQGGGGLGAFQVGALKNLYARGLEPIIITGTSVGALNGAKLAEGRGVDGVADLERLWRSLAGNRSIYVENPQFSDFGQDTLDEWKGWLTDLAVHFLFGGPALLPALADRPSVAGSIDEAMTDADAIESVNLQDPLLDRVEENIDPIRVACSGIKLRLATVTRDRGDVRYVTELGSVETEGGELVRIGRLEPAFLNREREADDPCPVADDVKVNRGDCMTAPNVADGVLASSAIPMFFKPWLMEGAEYYWDGAAKENAPVRKALELGATDVVVVLTSPAPWARRPATSPSSYALVVERLHQIDNPEGFTGKRGDYRAEVRVGDGDWMASRFREDDPDVFPRWTFQPVDGDIRLRVWDEEDSPDHCDVAPEDGRFDLLLHLDGETITGDLRGQVGDLLHARGGGDGNDVEVWLRIVGLSGGASAYLGGNTALSITPMRRALQLLGQMTAEVSEGDLSVLDTLDALHEVAQEAGPAAVLNGVRTFPLPRDVLGQAYTVPTYTVVDAPLVIGDVVDFDPSLIELNMEIGELAAKYTRVDFLDAGPAPQDEDGEYLNPTQDPDLSDDALEAAERDEILGLLRDRVERMLASENAEPALPRGWDRWDINRRKGYLQTQGRNRQRVREFRLVVEKELEKLENQAIVPSRRSPRVGEVDDLQAVPLPDPTECIGGLERLLGPPPIDECRAMADRIASLERRLAQMQQRLQGASPGGKAQLLQTIEQLERQLAAAREEYDRECAGPQ